MFRNWVKDVDVLKICNCYKVGGKCVRREGNMGEKWEGKEFFEELKNSGGERRVKKY